MSAWKRAGATARHRFFATNSAALPRGRGGLLLLPVLFLLGLLLLPRGALAIGENTGSLGGYVTAKGTKDGLAGIPLSLKSKQLIGGTQDKVTNDDGSYTFVNLPPGTYELSVKLEGFVPYRQLGIVINAGSRSEVDIALELATSPEMNEKTTIVEKVNPVLNPESAAATTPLNNQAITRSPSFRQEKGVAQFTPGVTRGGDRAVVRGGLGRFNRYYIDGLEVTDVTRGAFGSSSALINSDSVEQFVVSAGAMDAEYNSLGLVQNMVTRSGGNKFIVDSTVILQPPQFSATTRYPTNAPIQNSNLLYDNRPLPDRSFYSAAINFGGPIVKDKLWFWTNFQFNFNRLTFNISEQPWYGINAAYDRYQDQVLYLGRLKLTWQASRSTRVTLSYSLDFNDIINGANSSAVQGSQPNANNLSPEAELRFKRGGHWVGLLIDSLLTEKLLLQIQSGVFYKTFLEDSMRTVDGQPDRLTPSHQLLTSDAATNNFVFGNRNRPWEEEGKWSVQLAPTLLYTARGLGGQHQIKGGVQMTYMHYRHNLGIAGGQRFVDTVPGLPCDPGDSRTYASCNQLEVFPDSQPSAGRAGEGYTTTAQALNLGLFVQDKFTLMRWLTIVPGIRFDLGILYNTEGVRLQTLFGFGPRLSFIYDLFHDRTTLVVAHYGRHNDVGNAGIADRGNPTMTSSLQRFDATSGRFIEQRKTGGAGTQSFATDINFAPPRVDEASVGLHREVISQMVLGADYTFRQYANFWVNEEVNQIWDPAGNRVVGYQNGMRQRLFSASTPAEASREYHGLDLWVRGTPGSWDLVASYTLAYLNGTVTDLFDAGYKQNRRLDPLYYGALDGAPRHYLKGIVSYAFDFGLSLGTTLNYFTGAPLWKSFRSPEDNSFTYYRSPRGTSTGTRNNDPTTWAEFALPQTMNIDMQVGFNLKKLSGQNIDLIAMFFNVLNLANPTALDTRDGPAFGTATRRPDNFFCEVVLRYRY
jgi:hypothetical protein